MGSCCNFNISKGKKMSTEFLLTSLVVVLMPGTGVIYTVSTGLFLGRRASIAAAFGCTTGIIPHLTASILGLSAILHMSALAFHIIKYAGAFYLVYLAWVMWRETGMIQLNSSHPRKGCCFPRIQGRTYRKRRSEHFHDASVLGQLPFWQNQE